MAEVMYVDVDWDQEFRRVRTFATGIDKLVPDAILQLRVNGLENITFSNFNGSYFENTSSQTVATGDWHNRRMHDVFPASPDSGNLSIKCTVGGLVDYFTVPFVRSFDTYPNSFGLASKNSLNPNQEVVSTVRVGGINTRVSISLSGASDARLMVNNSGYWTRSSYVEDNDVVVLRSYAPSDYGQSRSYSLTIGSRSQSVSLSTKSEPEYGTLIRMPVSPDGLDFKYDIVDFFGKKQSAPDMKDYYRGAGLVPDFSANGHIPKSGSLESWHFEEAYTGFYFHNVPSDRSDAANTLNGAKTITLVWDWDAGDFTFGYGDIKHLVKVRYVVNQSEGSVSVSGAAGQNISSYSNNNTLLRVRKTASQNQEAICSGTITIYANFAGKTISKTVGYNIALYGP